jgi:hypothetical protein
MNPTTGVFFITAFSHEFYQKFPGGPYTAKQQKKREAAPFLCRLSFRVFILVYIISTSFAFGPLSVVSTSNWTRCPSCRLLNPADLMAE